MELEDDDGESEESRWKKEEYIVAIALDLVYAGIALKSKVDHDVSYLSMAEYSVLIIREM